MKKHRWMAVYMVVKYKPKKSVIIKSICYQSFETSEQALAWAFNYYDCAYLKERDNKKQSNYILWAGNPNVYGEFRHAVIVPIQQSFSIAYNDQNLKHRLEEMLSDWSNNGDDKKYVERSFMLSRLSWLTTIPNGWRLLRAGTTIKETDKQFSECTLGPNFWGIVPHYNIGKKIKRASGLNYVKTIKGKKVVYRKEPGHPDPLVIRKNLDLINN